MRVGFAFRPANPEGVARFADAAAHGEVVINATPLGMRGETLPEPFQRLTAGQVALDLVYNPPVAPAHDPLLVAAHHAVRELGL